MMRWLLLSFLVVILDQLSKYQASQCLLLFESVPIITGVNLTMVHNTGAAFGLLSQAGGWQRWLFIGITFVICTGIVIWLHSLPVYKRWLPASLALIIGGALGNLWDRIMLGYVIDFIELYYRSWSWPVFNLADSAITLGATMLFIDMILQKPAARGD